MQRIAAAVVCLLFTPSILTAQVRPEPRTNRGMARPAAVDVVAECALSAGESLVMRFGSCPHPTNGRLSKEIEIVEYRNGTAPSRVHRVTVRGWDMDLKHVAVVQLAWGDFDGDGRADRAGDVDGDGRTDLEAQAARVRPGRTKVGHVTLVRAPDAGAPNAGSGWPPADMDGDGFPMTVELRDGSSGGTTVALDSCRTTAGTEPREVRDSITLVCREVTFTPTRDADPYLRFVSRATSRSAEEVALKVERWEASLTARSAGDARVRLGATTTQLDGARVESWSVNFDPATGGTGRWTIGVRPGGRP